jgi:hypothetical protein
VGLIAARVAAHAALILPSLRQFNTAGKGEACALTFGSDLFKSDFEIPNDQLYSPKKAVQLVNNGLPHEPRHLANAYIQANIGFQLDIGIVPIAFAETEFEKLSFVFEKVGVQPPHLAGGEGWGKAPIDGYGNSRNDVELPVSVLSGAIVQELQPSAIFNGVRVTRIGSAVRLYGLEPRLQLIREWPFVGGTVFESLSASVDRKFQAVFVGGRIGGTLDFSGLEDDAVESSTQLIEKLSQLKSEVVFRDLAEPADEGDCPIALMLGADFKSFWLKESLPLLCKDWAMHCGPVETLPAILE